MAKKKSLLYGDFSNKSVYKYPLDCWRRHMFKVPWGIAGIQIILFFGSFVMSNPWNGFALLLIVLLIVVQVAIYNIEW